MKKLVKFLLWTVLAVVLVIVALVGYVQLSWNKTYEGGPMPWGMYSRMSENDLKALYRYLHSLEPVEFAVEKTVYVPGEQIPEL